ncbi:unnamed protein product [Nesidiocoris tenuis]|uniref:Uncharacterized protein n=1 Tax=Nesidiocoris tenuis TaxID=355587 RepID=A0A6H5GEU4_9HEMI|nr:unnamed protein product [Nesidiocoris tenuis]
MNSKAWPTYAFNTNPHIRLFLIYEFVKRFRLSSHRQYKTNTEHHDHVKASKSTSNNQTNVEMPWSEATPHLILRTWRRRGRCGGSIWTSASRGRCSTTPSMPAGSRFSAPIPPSKNQHHHARF